MNKKIHVEKVSINNFLLDIGSAGFDIFEKENQCSEEENFYFQFSVFLVHEQIRPHPIPPQPKYCQKMESVITKLDQTQSVFKFGISEVNKHTTLTCSGRKCNSWIRVSSWCFADNSTPGLPNLRVLCQGRNVRNVTDTSKARSYIASLSHYTHSKKNKRRDELCFIKCEQNTRLFLSSLALWQTSLAVTADMLN